VVVTVIKEDCSEVPVQVDIKGDRAEVKVGAHLINLTRDQAAVVQ
jgi:hypothetical protein